MILSVLVLVFGRACVFRVRLPAVVCTTVTAVATGAASVCPASGVGGLVSQRRQTLRAPPFFVVDTLQLNLENLKNPTF
ncbi:hypothetical protein PR003_g2238 [Phytophthora rubi]|uniref:Uncharacterized protein n=1 Tax=Phytophthora rubi TaxID=129364 RepID=A0A6A3P521_9STRA|nr:hypothetical protein PR002_g2347 [Phytophthora rubi]KAE9050580.1 hypothetical protein PR001_g2243 [Phytophthora rubi]KAE9356562.1 hypothetical protein PR003_g2238 [Phytophthora rubi]